MTDNRKNNCNPSAAARRPSIAVVIPHTISEDRVSVVHPGVSIARFSCLNVRSCRERIRARHGLSASDVVICFVGMNFEIKRLDLTIQGIAGMKRDGFFSHLPKLLIVGKRRLRTVFENGRRSWHQRSGCLCRRNG